MPGAGLVDRAEIGDLLVEFARTLDEQEWDANTALYVREACSASWGRRSGWRATRNSPAPGPRRGSPGQPGAADTRRRDRQPAPRPNSCVQ
jgi:hypothetical protein